VHLQINRLSEVLLIAALVRTFNENLLALFYMRGVVGDFDQLFAGITVDFNGLNLF